MSAGFEGSVDYMEHTAQKEARGTRDRPVGTTSAGHLSTVSASATVHEMRIDDDPRDARAGYCGP